MSKKKPQKFDNCNRGCAAKRNNSTTPVDWGKRMTVVAFVVFGPHHTAPS